MSHLPSDGVSRRTLAKGAAWAAPAVAVAAVAPMVAASPIPPRGLNGWVTLTRQCTRTNNEFQIDGRGTFTGGGNSDRGIWTFVDDPNAEISGAAIVFFFDTRSASFTNSSGGGWTNLSRATELDASAPAAGYYAYRATYSGKWTYFPRHNAWVADSDPYWLWNMPPGGCTTICGYARRSLTVNGETVTFTRGPVCV